MIKQSKPLLDDKNQEIINPINDRPYCSEHITYTIHPYHKKCHLCRIKDGDIEKCDNCSREHETNWDKCPKCGSCKPANFNTCFKCKN